MWQHLWLNEYFYASPLSWCFEQHNICKNWAKSYAGIRFTEQEKPFWLLSIKEVFISSTFGHILATIFFYWQVPRSLDVCFHPILDNLFIWRVGQNHRQHHYKNSRFLVSTVWRIGRDIQIPCHVRCYTVPWQCTGSANEDLKLGRIYIYIFFHFFCLLMHREGDDCSKNQMICLWPLDQ